MPFVVISYLYQQIDIWEVRNNLECVKGWHGQPSRNCMSDEVPPRASPFPMAPHVERQRFKRTAL
jgi:hypothetical protein